jgi:hypothetical protein
LRRLLDDAHDLTIDEAALAASALAALGGQGHDDAVAVLVAMAERASLRRRPVELEQASRGSSGRALP